MVIYLEVYIQAMCVDEAEVSPLAANTGQLCGCWWAESRVMDRSRHTHTGQQLEGVTAPQSHLWVREVSYGMLVRIGGQW